MSNTPRTDAIAHRGYHLDALAARSIDLCRELERDNAALRAQLSAVQSKEAKRLDELQETQSAQARLRADNSALRAHIERIRHEWTNGTEDELAESVLNASSATIAAVEETK